MDKVEGNVLFLFLKLIYNPYLDYTSETLHQLIIEIASFTNEIRKY